MANDNVNSTEKDQELNTNNSRNPDAGGTRANGIGDGGSTGQTKAYGSDGSGGKGSIAEGVDNAGGDSVKGSKIMGSENNK